MTYAPMKPVYLRAKAMIFLTVTTVVLTVVKRDGDYLTCVSSSLSIFFLSHLPSFMILTSISGPELQKEEDRGKRDS